MPTPRLRLLHKRLTTLFDKIVTLINEGSGSGVTVQTLNECGFDPDRPWPSCKYPGIKLYPANGPTEFYTPSDQIVPLVVTAELYVMGRDPRNLLDLWETAIVHPLYESDQVRWDLQRLGAETGMAQFTGLQYRLAGEKASDPLVGTTQILLNVKLGLDF